MATARKVGNVEAGRAGPGTSSPKPAKDNVKRIKRKQDGGGVEFDGHVEQQGRQSAKDEIEEIFSTRKKARSTAPGAGSNGDGKSAGGGRGEDAGGGSSKDRAVIDIDTVDAAQLESIASEVQKARARSQADKPAVQGSKDDIFGQQSGKARKRTQEGYAIYTEDELGCSRGGGDTDLCPFDCDCCF